MRKAAYLESRTNFFTTTAHTCAHMQRRFLTSPPPCCLGPIAFPLTAPLVTFASPTRHPAAHIARPAVTSPHLCASDYLTPLLLNLGWTGSRFASAISSTRRRCPIPSASTPSAQKSSTIP